MPTSALLFGIYTPHSTVQSDTAGLSDGGREAVTFPEEASPHPTERWVWGKNHRKQFQT